MLLAAPVAVAQTDPADRKAAELMAASNWAEAASVLRELVESAPTATRLFNLAQAERNLGEYASAKQHFSAALARAKVEGLDAVAQAAEAARRDVEPKVSRLVLTFPDGVSGAAVRIDGRPVELDDANTLEVNPGKRHLAVQAAGYRSFERTLAPRAGDRLEISIELEAESASTPSGGPGSGDTGTTVTTGSGGGPPLPALILGGVGVVALAGSAVFYLQAQSKFDDAEACGASDCGKQNFEAFIADGESSLDTANILWPIGAVALAAGGTWWLLSGSGESSTSARVVVGPGQAHVGLRMTAF